jgi:hypothetical protein
VTPATSLALTGRSHDLLRKHLFPGDGLEAAAILVCTRVPGARRRLLVREVLAVPHSECGSRARDSITWPGAWVECAIDVGEPLDATLILAHSHPGGLLGFSHVDDASDRLVIPSLFHAYGGQHGSAVMTGDGAIVARLYDRALAETPVDLVSVAGDDLDFYWRRDRSLVASRRRPLAFTKAMSEELSRLTAVIVGVSGTGSIAAEQAARLGFGRVILIDFDKIEKRNLNRILNSTLRHVADEALKVAAFAHAISLYRGAGVAEPVPVSLMSREAVLAAAEGDVLFSCVDTLEARQLCDLISSAFLMPLFDVGVVIPVRGEGDSVAIADVCGRLDYVQPGGSTLFDRGVWSPEALRAEYLRAAAPEAHRDELAAGYIKGLVEEAPSVITLNMRAAAAMMNEFIARAYPFRLDPNARYARTTFSLAACEEEYAAEIEFSRSTNPLLARGDAEPLLGLPVLKAPRLSR